VVTFFRDHKGFPKRGNPDFVKGEPKGGQRVVQRGGPGGNRQKTRGNGLPGGERKKKLKDGKGEWDYSERAQGKFKCRSGGQPVNPPGEGRKNRTLADCGGQKARK